MRILHVSATDTRGGAARAAYRIHHCLLEHGDHHGFQSRFRVINSFSDDPTVIGGPSKFTRGFLQSWVGPRINSLLNQHARRGFRSGNPTLHSIAWPATGLGQELLGLHSRGHADVVHLHWLGDATLSIEEIGRLPMPLVWTLHDQWVFCGAEHYTSPPLPDEPDSRDERYVVGYTPASRPSHEAGPDLNRNTWQRKHRSWQRSIQIVCPSTWLGDCARRSRLIGDWPITVIPYPIDLQIWAPFDQRHARALLNLPEERPLVLFGADGGTSDPRKGADLLLQALQLLRIQSVGTPLEHVELVVFGQGRPAHAPNLGFPIHYSGRLHDDLCMRLHYAAADVMVVPSRQEAFGQTASEAHACGTPVVAFRTGGLIDVVDDHITGALAEPFDPASLAKAIRWVVDDPQRRFNLGVAARQRAQRLWDPELVSSSYAQIYHRILNCGCHPIAASSKS